MDMKTLSPSELSPFCQQNSSLSDSSAYLPITVTTILGWCEYNQEERNEMGCKEIKQTRRQNKQDEMTAQLLLPKHCYCKNA